MNEKPLMSVSPLTKIRISQIASLGFAIAVAATIGCDAPIPTFRPNLVLAKSLELNVGMKMEPAVNDSQSILDDLFGTPDNPKWPKVLLDDEKLASLVRLDRLNRAAGRVRSDEQDVHFGLYREHCVHCHGTTGHGVGPTSSFLNPYPRDFRMGIFKFKTTPKGKKPTRADLTRLLNEGIMGTSMPSFRLLKPDDLDALVDYAIYLSVRGEVERKLLLEAANELDLDAGQRLLDPKLKESAPDEYQSQLKTIEDMVTGVAQSWVDAEDAVTIVAEPPKEYPLFGRDSAGPKEVQERLQQSIAHGRTIYHGKVANCASCHGSTAMGDGQKSDYDDWTKDWTTRANLDPKNKEEIQPMVDLGALKPRNILPRNLRTGIFRGGSQPVDLYHRLAQGIDGTPMPALAMKPDNPLGLSQEEVWDLVNYLLSLPYEHISQQSANVPPFQREMP